MSTKDCQNQFLINEILARGYKKNFCADKAVVWKHPVSKDITISLQQGAVGFALVGTQKAGQANSVFCDFTQGKVFLISTETFISGLELGPFFPIVSHNSRVESVDLFLNKIDACCGEKTLTPPNRESLGRVLKTIWEKFAKN